MAGDFGSSTRSTALMPAFVALAYGNNSFKGKIQDDAATYEVKNLSFGGVIKIEGVRKKEDDSNTILQLEIVQKIEVLKANFESTDARHRTAPEYPLFIEAKITFFSGKSEVFLLPHNLTICGEQITSGAQKAWFVRDIKSVENLGKFAEAPGTVTAPKIPREHMAPETTEQPKPVEERSVLGKIWDATIGRFI